MSLSACSEIFLLPLSASLTAGDWEYPKGYSSKRLPADPAVFVGRKPGLKSDGSLRLGDTSSQLAEHSGSGLSFDTCFLADHFLADQSNYLLRVFDDLACLDFIYGPIVLFGPSQSGKSLLSRGLAQRLAKNRCYRTSQLSASNGPEESLQGDSHVVLATANQARAICVSASDWSRQLQEAVETNAIAEFRQRFLLAGSVLIDDLTLLKNSPFAQAQLVVLLDLLEDAAVPVFLTSTFHPSQLESFRPDLVSRLLGGLVLPVHLPGAAAKRAYLSARANQLKLCLGSDCLDWLAALAPLPSFSAIEGFLLEFSLRCRQSALRPVLTDIKAFFTSPTTDTSESITELIIDIVAEFYELNSEQLKSPCRRQTTVLARGMALILIRQLCQLSSTSLGNIFGNRDHSTILAALQTTERRLRTELPIRSALMEIIAGIHTKTAQLKLPLSTESLCFESFLNNHQRHQGFLP